MVAVASELEVLMAYELPITEQDMGGQQEVIGKQIG